MSIICECTEGWLIDHKQFIDNTYKKCLDLRNPPDVSIDQNDKNEMTENTEKYESYVLDEVLFDIHDQFRMDSWFQSRKREAESSVAQRQDEHVDKKIRKKKRKKPTEEPNEGILAANKYHFQVKDIIVKATDQLRMLARDRGYFQPHHYKASTNNKEARELAKELESEGPAFAEWCTMSRDFPPAEEVVRLDQTDGSDEQLLSLVNTLVYNSNKMATVKRLLGETYLLPPDSTFLMADISNTAPLSQDGRKYDLVVMDPPWCNKSVKRQKKYCEVQEDSLLQLPVLSAPGGLLVVWTTNRAAHHNFIKDRLFPHWGAQHSATWHWVKVTQTGAYVTDIDDVHGKRCYETILVGRVSHDETLRSHIDGDVTSLSSPLPRIPDQKVLVSVPCSVHSSKPPLLEVLSPYLAVPTRRPRCVELFARSLQPGWTSWGNEVLKFQHVNFYRKLIQDSADPNS